MLLNVNPVYHPQSGCLIVPDSNGNISITDRNTVSITTNGSHALVRSSVVRGGKWYVEGVFPTSDVTGYQCFGIVTPTTPSTTILYGTNALSWGGAGDGVFAASGGSDIRMMAVDTVTRKIWCGVNGTWTGGKTPGVDMTGYVQLAAPGNTALPAPFVPAIGLYASGDTMVSATLRTLPSEFTYRVPIGFTALGEL